MDIKDLEHLLLTRAQNSFLNIHLMCDRRMDGKLMSNCRWLSLVDKEEALRSKVAWIISVQTNKRQTLYYAGSTLESAIASMGF